MMLNLLMVNISLPQTLNSMALLATPTLKHFVPLVLWYCTQNFHFSFLFIPFQTSVYLFSGTPPLNVLSCSRLSHRSSCHSMLLTQDYIFNYHLYIDLRFTSVALDLSEPIHHFYLNVSKTPQS